MAEALALLDEQTGRRVVLALTDGEDTASESANLDIAIAAARRLGLPVYTLGLGTEEEIASGDLRRLATSTRAQYYPARNADQLKAIYETIAARIGAGYTLVYESDRRLPDGTLRPVRIFHRGSSQAGETAVFIPGMVVPAGGWSPLFLALLAVLAALALVPSWLSRGKPALGLGHERLRKVRFMPASHHVRRIWEQGREGMERRAKLMRWLRLVTAAVVAGLAILALMILPALVGYLPRAIRGPSSGVVGRGAGRRLQGGPCLCRGPAG